MLEAGLSRENGLSSAIGKIQKQIIVLTGPEGSGKTTQGKMLAYKLGVPKVAMGDVFRELSKQDTELGRRSKRLFEEHVYSDISLFREAFVWRMQRDDVKQGFILEGGFRFTDEVTSFEQMLEETGNAMPIKVLYLRIPGWKGAERLLKRGREDDTEEGILSRLTNHYHKLGERMSKAQKKWPFFMIIVGDKAEQQIHEEIMQKISESSQ